jgi:hypothetical protein
MRIDKRFLYIEPEVHYIAPPMTVAVAFAAIRRE